MITFHGFDASDLAAGGKVILCLVLGNQS